MTMLYRNMTHRMMDREINLQPYRQMERTTLSKVKALVDTGANPSIEGGC